MFWLQCSTLLAAVLEGVGVLGVRIRLTTRVSSLCRSLFVAELRRVARPVHCTLYCTVQYCTGLGRRSRRSEHALLLQDGKMARNTTNLISRYYLFWRRDATTYTATCTGLIKSCGFIKDYRIDIYREIKYFMVSILGGGKWRFNNLLPRNFNFTFCGLKCNLCMDASTPDRWFCGETDGERFRDFPGFSNNFP